MVAPSANPHGVKSTDEDRAARIALLQTNNYNVSKTAREIGISRSSMRTLIKRWIDDGLITKDALHAANAPKIEEIDDARRRKREAFRRKAQKGDWRKPVAIRMPSKPFRLKLFGDPHIEADGTDFDLFEEHFQHLSDPDVYGICVGDWFNNWPRALAGLYAEETTRPSDGWILLTNLMEQHGEGLIAACSGNHDDWAHGPADPVVELMRQHGVVYRKGAVRISLWFEDLKREITVAIRHKWRGHSMYSPAHGITRAARFGWRDHISTGGHIHQDEPRMYAHPDGFKQHCCQLSAFKEFDEFPDVQGFMPHRISPVWDLVIDPRCSDDDADMVKTFWDSNKAASYLRALQMSNAA